MNIKNYFYMAFLCLNMLLALTNGAQAAPDSVAKSLSIFSRVGQWLGIVPPTPKTAAAVVAAPCDKPVYLTFDTGDMEIAPLVAEILNKHQVQATFFVSNEKTKDGKDSMSFDWGQKFWALRGKEGHEFASRTWDEVAWRSDAPGLELRFVVQPGMGAFAGRSFTWEAAKYCAQIAQSRDRLEDFIGKKALPLWRAPGGASSAKLVAAAKACGYQIVPASGVVQVEDAVLAGVIANASAGSMLSAQLGSARQPQWAATNLVPLIVGIKERGLCFATLRNHPSYKPWIAAQGQ